MPPNRCIAGAAATVRCSRFAPRNLRYAQAAASASLRLLMRAAPAAHLPAVPARFAPLRFLRAIHGLLAPSSPRFARARATAIHRNTLHCQ
jgi:hypothetical protein